MELKKCFKCDKTKPLTLFYRHRQMGDGYLGKCKACTKNDVKDRYYSSDGSKKVRKYERSRTQTAHRKRKALEYQRTRRLKYPGRDRARQKVNHAVRLSDIRKPCEVCGTIKVEGHHTDYRKPLNVRWLCFVHHRQVHGQLQSA